MQTESPFIHDNTDHSKFGKVWIADQFTLHHKRLYQIVQFRLDFRLRARLGPDDVLQEAYLDCVKRQSYFHDGMSPFVQIRQVLLQTLIDVHRRHLLVQARTVARENSPNGGPARSRSSITLARLLQAEISSPSASIKQAETFFKLNQAIDSLSKVDCEILLMRHFEDMTNREVAEALQLRPDTACQRYLRALARLKTILESLSHFAD